MEQSSNQAFLASLPVFAEFEDVADPQRYRPLPDGWALATADIVASGQAISAGRYKMVNMAGAAVISAVLNGLGRSDYPFAFGGDGATVAVPPDGMVAARAALAAVSIWVTEALQLQMRTALVPVSAIRAAGLEVQVARLQASPDMAFAMFAGGGAAWAEAQMKAGAFAVDSAPPGTEPDLTGLSCRWDPLAARNGAILSVIAVPGPGGATAGFRALVAEISAMANATPGQGHVMPLEGPRPRLSFAGVAAEARAAPAARRFRARVTAMVGIVLTVVLHRLNLSLGGFNARTYARGVAANSDFRKFDDGLKMTVDIDAAGSARIASRLEQAARDGICLYGLHSQAEALVTCIVMSLEAKHHMHFVDGAAGGYAMAAANMKAKLIA